MCVFIRKVLLDETEKMPTRYAALFGLRNRGNPEAVEAIVASLQCESALLKHEVGCNDFYPLFVMSYSSALFFVGV